MAELRHALMSVSDKSGVVDMAKGLSGFGATILSTGGTAKALRDAGLTVMDVSSYTGSPEILDGRVKTLHPKIHGGLLGRRNVDSHVAQMQEQGIDPIDVVVVNLYPFESTIAKPGCTFEEAIENIDIGGPSMLRSAAKNHEDVLVVVDPLDYSRVLDALSSGNVPLTLAVNWPIKCIVIHQIMIILLLRIWSAIFNKMILRTHSFLRPFRSGFNGRRFYDTGRILISRERFIANVGPRSQVFQGPLNFMEKRCLITII